MRIVPFKTKRFDIKYFYQIKFRIVENLYIMDENHERQADELSTLESICGENEFSYSLSEKQPIGFADIEVVISSPIVVYYTDPKISLVQSITLSHLPPIRLHFRMPEQYPNSQPPEYTLSCKWLSYKQMVQICQQLDLIWNTDAGEEVLYKWMQFLKHEAIEFLQIKEINLAKRKTSLSRKSSVEINENSVSNIEKENVVNNKDKVSNDAENDTDIRKLSHNLRKDSRVLLERCSYSLITDLKEHDEKCLQQEFNLSVVYCEICCMTNSGLHSVRFSCTHEFCKACVTEYILTKVGDGNVIGIACPAIDCKHEINVSQIKNLVNTEQFLKYEKLLLSQTLDTMMDIIYCPRVVCQYPVTYDPSETVASCPNCLYSFCILCKRVYHGVEPCKLKKEDRLDVINKYQNGTEEYRKQVNKRYGELYIKRLLEDHASEETISNSTKACPKCGVQIEKSEGCNKMTCNRCQTFFCYICSTVLCKSDPYDHFANPVSPCYNKLFPHERDEDDVDDFLQDLLF